MTIDLKRCWRAAMALVIGSFAVGCDGDSGQVPIGPTPVVCGDVVCPAGQICLDSSTSTCGVAPTTPSGFTACGSIQCSPGQYCAAADLEVCENGCLSNANCQDNQTCVKDTAQNTGICQNNSGPETPCEEACSAALACELFDAPAAANCKLFCSEATPEEQAAVSACAQSASCQAGLPQCFGVECGGVFACGNGLTCVDGLCATEGCTPQCAGQFCGDNGCGGSCGQCFPGETCNASGLCLPDLCIPDCAGKFCGDDGCGGSCGQCFPGETCNANGLCLPDLCTPDCADKVCGDDGCGGSCGTCAAGLSCNDAGACIDDVCVPECTGKVCGADGCGGSCGSCAAGQSCNDAGACVDDVCIPQCSGKACGADGCGGSCGSCASGQSCNDAGACIDDVCVPSCANAQCGPDGCGGSCGTCAGNTQCNTATAQCECAPNCAGKSCGDDGCGGTCGPGCSAGQTCDTSSGVCQDDAPACDVVGGFANGQVLSAEQTLNTISSGFTSTQTPEDGQLFKLVQVDFWFFSLGTLPAVFDLALPSGWQDCTACVLAADSCSNSKSPPCNGSTEFIATSGTVTVTQFGTAGEPLEYHLTDVVLSEAILNPETFESTLVPGGTTWCLPGTIFAPATTIQ